MKAFDVLPTDWRKGQTVFSFLQWMRDKGHGDSSEGRRMADPFHVPDTDLDRLYEEFLEYIEAGGRHG